MMPVHPTRRSVLRTTAASLVPLSLAAVLAAALATVLATVLAAVLAVTASAQGTPDPRVGLKAGLMDAAEASWNLRVLSKTQPTEKFLGSTNSDMAFTGNYVIQGSYNGYQIWDISNPSKPTIKIANYCPASQSDVSVYGNLLFVSSEGTSGRIDCGAQGVKDAVSQDRLRGIRIFDITDMAHPKNVDRKSVV